MCQYCGACGGRHFANCPLKPEATETTCGCRLKRDSGHWSSCDVNETRAPAVKSEPFFCCKDQDNVCHPINSYCSEGLRRRAAEGCQECNGVGILWINNDPHPPTQVKECPKCAPAAQEAGEETK